MKAAAVSVACIALAAIGCNSSNRAAPTTFTTYPASSDGAAQQIGSLQTTQNPVPIDPRIHVHGPNNTAAFGQQFHPTSVIDPKERIEQNTVSTTTTTTTSTTFPQVKP